MGRTTVVGLGKVKAEIAKMGAKIHAASDVAARGSADAAASSMHADVPIDTGALDQSIVVTRVGDADYEVGPTADHAQFVEFATSDTPAQPFVTPAAEAQTNAHPARVIATVRQALQ